MTERSGNENRRTTTADGIDTSSSFSPTVPVHPEVFLKIRQRLNGKLRSRDGKASVYASPSDGSLMHEKSEGERSSVDLDGQTDAATSKITTVLIKSNPRKLKRAMRIRADTIAVIAVDEERELEEAGERPKKGKVQAKVMPWLPFGKWGFIRTLQRNHARDHLMEVEVSLTARGNIVSTQTHISAQFTSSRGIGRYNCRCRRRGIIDSSPTFLAFCSCSNLSKSSWGISGRPDMGPLKMCPASVVKYENGRG